MPAASTDKFIKGSRKLAGTIDASGISDASVDNFGLSSVAGLPADTAVEITVDRVDSNGAKTPAKEEVIRGIVSGSRIVSAVRGVEGTAQSHTPGAVWEVRLTASMWNRLIDGLLVFATQTGKIILSAMDGSRYAADAGGDDAYEVTLDPAPAAYYAGMEVNFKPTTANTGACTLNVNGLGAKTIKKNVSSDLATGDILAGQMVKVLYDGTNFQLVSDIPITTDVTGWNVYSAVVPTRASADDPTYVLTFAGVDLTSMLSVGMRIKWTQNATVRYAIITAISFSTNTTLTVYGGTDYDVDDTATFAISAFYFSTMKAPLGFPVDPLKWTVQVTDTNIYTQASPVSGTWYNLGTTASQLSLPIGAWRVQMKAMVEAAASAGCTVKITLSTTNSSESDSDFTRADESSSSTAYRPSCSAWSEKCLLIASKTLYYLNCQMGGTTATLWLRGDVEKTVIRAVCAYL